MKVVEILQSFLLGLALVFMLFCIFWSAIYASYMQYYGIAEFFNPFFSNVFSPTMFFISVVAFGIGLSIPALNGVFKILFFCFLFCALVLFIRPFGRFVGDVLLSQELIVQQAGEEKRVKSLYEGRSYFVYLSEDSEDFAVRKQNLIYHKKPTAK